MWRRFDSSLVENIGVEGNSSYWGLYLGPMSPAADNACGVPLLSRRRGSLLSSDSITHAGTVGGDIEQGGGRKEGIGLAASDSTINVRVKTAGDGREYRVSASLTSTVAEVRDEEIYCCCFC